MLLCCPESFPAVRQIRDHFVTFLLFALFVICSGTLVCQASTGYPNEISNISVQNVTPTSADVVWDTVHPSTSQIVIARDRDYQGERRITGSGSLVNHHRVTVDHLLPYDASEGLGTYYFYVASVDANSVLSTSPGPYDSYMNDPSTVLLPLQTAPPDANRKSNYVVYTAGPMNVYAGSDLYFSLQVAQLAGSHPGVYVHNQKGYNNGSDGVVKAAANSPSIALNPQTISVHLQCLEYNANNRDADDQYYDSGKNMGMCWSFEYHLITVRLRTSPNTVRGNYGVTVTLQDNGQDVSTTYYFTVLPAPNALQTHTAYPQPIPGRAQWESYMTQLGHKYCDDSNYAGSRDSLNAAGNFLTGWGWEGDAWYYDGGRVYQQVESYTNDRSWNHCALTILDPYRQWIVANQAALPLYAIFPYGMAMNYWRTGDTANSAAIQALATQPYGSNVGGWVDPFYIRETAYGADVRIANELITKKRDRLLAKSIDKLLGHLDMAYNGQLGSVHPFMVGLAMETAIHYYDMTVAEGHPDYRIPPAVKRALDALWRDYYVPSTHAFRFTRWDMPTIDTWSVLNDLVAPAYAWHWSITADGASMSRGDDLFQHVFDVPADFTWSGKQFSQIYKWSFDFVRWRSGQANSTTIVDNNPFTGPYPDTEPPIESQVAVPTITNTSATITWKTYEPADSQIIYGVVNGFYPLQSVLLDTGGNMKQLHSVTLTGLLPQTTYHYRVNSHDAAHNLASLADATFTTPAGGSNAGSGNGSGTNSAGVTSGADASSPSVMLPAAGVPATTQSNAYTSKALLMQ